MLANQLSIYKETYKLVKLLVVQVSKMPRLHKFTLGERILNTAYSLFSHIQLANMYKEERNEHLKMFIVEFETLKTLIRLAFELRAIEGVNRQVEIFAIAESIGRQVTAWKNSKTKRREAESNASLGQGVSDKGMPSPRSGVGNLPINGSSTLIQS